MREHGNKKKIELANVRPREVRKDKAFFLSLYCIICAGVGAEVQRCRGAGV